MIAFLFVSGICAFSLVLTLGRYPSTAQVATEGVRLEELRDDYDPRDSQARQFKSGRFTSGLRVVADDNAADVTTADSIEDQDLRLFVGRQKIWTMGPATVGTIPFDLVGKQGVEGCDTAAYPLSMLGRGGFVDRTSCRPPTDNARRSTGRPNLETDSHSPAPS